MSAIEKIDAGTEVFPSVLGFEDVEAESGGGGPKRGDLDSILVDNDSTTLDCAQAPNPSMTDAVGCVPASDEK